MTKKIEIKPTKEKGRAAFAVQKIKKGSMICNCPVVVFSSKEVAAIRSTILDSYIFAWPGIHQSERSKTWSRFCVALGEPSIINHSSSPNAFWSIDKKKETLSFYAVRDILAGEEILHNYHWPKRMLKNFKE